MTTLSSPGTYCAVSATVFHVSQLVAGHCCGHHRTRCSVHMVVVADGLGITFPAREDLAAVAAHADIIVRDALIEILNHMLCRKIRHRLIKRIENLTFDMSSHVVKGAEVDGGQ